MHSAPYLGRHHSRRFVLIGVLLILSKAAQAQEWTWTSETIDDSGTFSALVVDNDGNVHIGYLSPDGGGTKYGFRSADTGRWSTMVVDKNNGPVNLALDSQQHPHLCYTGYQILKYAHWDGRKWEIQEIAPRSGERAYTCGIAIGLDDAPHVTWYQLIFFSDPYYVHLRHAVLKYDEKVKEKVWLANTVDFGFETGKWNCLRVDVKGNLHVSLSAYKDGALHYARSDPEGTAWTVTTIEDGKTGHHVGETPGMGNSMVLDKDGNANFSYRDEATLRYAWPAGNHWRIDVVDPNANPYGNTSWINQRTALALDTNGNPHIAYETDGSLKHAWWDGARWRIQPMGIAGPKQRYPSIAISRDNVIYMGYSSPEDGSLRVLVGKPKQQAAAKEKR